MKIAHHTMTWGGWFSSQNLPYDWATVLAELTAAGFDAFEAGGTEKDLGPAKVFAHRVADAGHTIVAWSAGVTANYWPPNTDEYRRELTYAAELGLRTVAVCGGFLPEQRRTTSEGDYRQFADNLGQAMDFGNALGLTLAFHPHRGCIVETNAEVERLLRYLPGLQLCVDTGHLMSVGSDPIALIDAHPTRIAHVHLKDWNVATRAFTEIGAGNAGLDFMQILLALRKARYTGALVIERDAPPMAAKESARVSRENLMKALLAVSP